MPIVAMPDGTNVSFPDDMASEKIKTLIQSKFPDAAKGATPTPEAVPQSSFGNNRGAGSIPSGANLKAGAIDATESLASGVSKAPFWLNDMVNQVTTTIKGTVNDALNGDDPLDKGSQQAAAQANTNPLPTSTQMVQGMGIPVHTPTTPIGEAADVLGQAAGMGGFKKATDIVGSRAPGFSPKAPVNSAIPDELGIMEDVPNKATFSSGKVNPVDAGYKANKALSEAYDADKTIQKTAYDKVNASGSALSVKAPELYKTGDSIVQELSEKVAKGSKEEVALNNLKEIIDNIKEKNGIASKPAEQVDLDTALSRVNPPAKAEAGIKAYGIQPSDLIDIKTTLNELAKPSNEFSNAGKAKILEYKKAVQAEIDNAASVSPEFGADVKAAEAAAAKVSQYKAPELSPLWQPEDHMAWKAAQNNPTGGLPGKTAGTDSRATMLLDNLNKGNTGAITTLINTVGEQKALPILRDAYLNSAEDNPTLKRAFLQLATGNPRWALNTGIRSVGRTQTTPLADLADEVSKIGTKSNPIEPPRLLGKAVTAGAATGAALDAARAGFKASPTQNTTGQQDKTPVQSAPLKPQSLNQGDTNAGTQTNVADNGSLPPKSDSGFHLSDLSPISDAEAATIKGATKYLDPKSAMAKNVRAIPQDEKVALESAGKKYGVNMADYLAIRNAESSVSSKPLDNGPVQMTSAAWKDAEKSAGRKLDRNNPHDYAEASMAFIKHTRDQIKQPGQGTPGIIDTYIAFNAGVSGYKSLKTAKPNAKSIDIVGSKTADNNPKFYFNSNGKPLTVAQTKQAYADYINHRAETVVPGPKSIAAARATKEALSQARTQSTDGEPDTGPQSDNSSWLSRLNPISDAEASEVIDHPSLKGKSAKDFNTYEKDMATDNSNVRMNANSNNMNTSPAEEQYKADMKARGGVFQREPNATAGGNGNRYIPQNENGGKYTKGATIGPEGYIKYGKAMSSQRGDLNMFGHRHEISVGNDNMAEE